MGDGGADDSSVAGDPLAPVTTRSVLTRGSVGLRIVTIVLLVVVGGFGLADVIDNPRTDLLTNAVLYGLICTLFLSLATTRVISSGSRLLIVNPVSITEIPSALIESVDGENGLRITTRSGEELGFWGYGSSLLGNFVAYRGPRRAATRIREWHAQQNIAQKQHETPDRIRHRPRVSGPIIAVGAIAAFASLGLLLG